MPNELNERSGERQSKESEESARARRERMVKLGSAAFFAAVIVVAIAIALLQSGDDEDPVRTGVVLPQLDGLPQEGAVLGEPSSAVEVIEFGDLQCVVCALYAGTIVGGVIEGPVRDGEATIEFRNLAILGPDSVTAAKATLAAGEQDRLWQYVEIFYRNQESKNSGFVTDQFLRTIARRAEVPDLNRWEEDRASPRWDAELTRTRRDARRLGFSEAPAFLVRGPDGTRRLSAPVTPQKFAGAIAAAG